MSEEKIKRFINLKDPAIIHGENKTWFVLYLVFALVFIGVPSLLCFLETSDPKIFAFLCAHIIGALVFLVWLVKAKRRASLSGAFLFSSLIMLAISLLWFSSFFVNIYAHQIEQSPLYMFAALIGLVIFLGLCVLRYRKWLNLKKESDQADKYKPVYYTSTTTIVLILLFLSRKYLGVAQDDFSKRIVICGAIILGFIFLALSFINLHNTFILKKHHFQ